MLGYINYGANKIATHQFTEAGEVVNVERITPGAGITPSDWDSSVTTTTLGLVSGLGCVSTGRGRIILSAASTGAIAGDTFSFRLVAYNSETQSNENIIGVSALISQDFVDLQNNAGQLVSTYSAFANDCGASYVAILLVSLPSSATITLNMAAI